MSILFIAIIILTILFIRNLSRSIGRSKLPPGPKPWPIIGNIHQIDHLPHRKLAELSKIYGPLMSLKLGSITTIVISSPNIAKEMFVKHDLAFSSRRVPHIIGKVANHGELSMVWLPVCPKWRDLRKIMTIQLFTSQRLDASQVIRQKKVNDLVEYVRHCSENGLAVDIGKAAFTTSLNLLSNTFFSMDLASHDSSSSQEFKESIGNLVGETGRPNISDLFPLVKHLDLRGVEKRARIYFYKIFETFEKIIDERLKLNGVEAKEDVLGTLLKLVQQNELSLDEMKHMLVDLFIGGTESTSISLEWAMTELLCNPKKMAKAQDELDQVLGKNNGSMQESDISNLPYIQAIVKETLRLHPPAPFLLPHKAVKDVEFCGYYVPKNALVWVNVWAIGRDPSVWQNPLSFKPERFLDSEIDMRGLDFELIPFGAGRRVCPGLILAHRIVHLELATLLYTFDWKYGDVANECNIDVEEKFGLSLQKALPLLAIPLVRHFHD